LGQLAGSERSVSPVFTQRSNTLLQTDMQTDRQTGRMRGLAEEHILNALHFIVETISPLENIYQENLSYVPRFFGPVSMLQVASHLKTAFAKNYYQKYVVEC